MEPHAGKEEMSTGLAELDASERREGSDTMLVASVGKGKGRNRQKPKFSRKDAVRIEDAMERRQRDMEEMEDAIDWENKGHLKVMEWAWEKYRKEVDSETRRHNEVITDIYETYQGRISVHEKVLREMSKKAVSMAETETESDVQGNNEVEEESGVSGRKEVGRS